MRARFYHVELKRFICEDPIKDGSNWYAYCNGNPIRFVDINGLQTDEADTRDLRWWLKQFNGKLRVNENTVDIVVWGIKATIDIHSEYNYDGTLKFTAEEFMELLGLKCETTTETVKVTQSDYRRKSQDEILNDIFCSLEGLVDKFDVAGNMGLLSDLSELTYLLCNDENDMQYHNTIDFSPGNYTVNTYYVPGYIMYVSIGQTGVEQNLYTNIVIWYNPDKSSITNILYSLYGYVDP